MSRLYTVNKWNRKKFLDKNLFEKGGEVQGFNIPNIKGLGFPDASPKALPKVQMKFDSSKLKPLDMPSGGKSGGGDSGGMPSKFGFLAGIPETSFKLGKTNYKRGLWDAADPLYQLAGNKESAVGNAFSDAGVGMFKSAAKSGNAWGMLAGGITKGLGSLINAAWGIEEDKDLKAGVDAGIDYNNRFMSTAGSYDDLVGPNAVVDNSNVYKGGWFVKGKARRKNANLALNIARGKQRAEASIANNIYNIADDQLLNGLRGYFAYGGPFDPVYNGSDMGAIGYNLASDFLNIKKEQAENKGNGAIPTYFAEGGKIHINPKNRGKFNATKKRTGKTTEELTHSKNPLTRKRAIFAQNAKKWRHDYGGPLFDSEELEDVAPADATYVDKDVILEEPRHYPMQLMRKVTKYPLSPNEERQELIDAALDSYFTKKPIKRELRAVRKKLEEGNEEYTQQLMHSIKRLDVPSGEWLEELMQNKGIHAFGGDLETNGSDFPTGLTHVDTGGSHEENPYEGVQMGVDRKGTPNLVEEDEVVYEDYVFSNRIYCDEETKQKFHISKSRKITFAQLAKKLEKEIAERPNDPISEAGFKAQMETLREEQERQKQEMEAERAKAAFEALSPEEQVAVMNRAAQEEQMAQQAMQEQAMAQQAAEQQEMMQPSPEEAAMAQEQMIPETENAVAPQMQAEGGHLFAVGGVKPYAYSRNWDDFAYFNPETNSYDEGYLNFVRGINQDWVDRILAGQYGPMNRYLTRNRGVKLTPEQVIALGTDKRNSDMHKALAAAYKEYLDSEGKVPTLPEVEVVAQRPSLATPEFVVNESDLDAPIAVVETPNGPAVVTASTESNTEDNTSSGNASTKGPVEPLDIPDRPGLGFPDAAVTTQTTPKINLALDSSPVTDVEKDKESGIVPRLKAEWPRYAGLFGPAVGLGLMAAGVGKPDYGRLDAAVEGLGEYTPADWKPIGNYLTYRPMDIWYEQNRMNANARATDRAIMNNSAPVGTKNASLLANAYNNQLASADLYRKALEYNDAKQAQVENFNRGTDMFNSEAYNKNSMFNADAANRQKQYRAGLALRAAQQRLDSDAGWYNSLYGNIGGLFKGIGDLGRDNMEDNWRKALVVSGALGNFNEDALIAAGIAQTAEDAKNAKRKKSIFGWNVTKAVGGELKKKKKKRGFTY